MIEIDDKAFRDALNHIAALPEGQIVLAILKESCGWDDTILSSDNPQTTQYFAARRGVYGSLRKLIRTEHLKKIEFDYKKKVAKNDRPDSRHSSAARKPKPTGN
jgi:hypothetical protein